MRVWNGQQMQFANGIWSGINKHSRRKSNTPMSWIIIKSGSSYIRFAGKRRSRILQNTQPLQTVKRSDEKRCYLLRSNNKWMQVERQTERNKIKQNRKGTGGKEKWMQLNSIEHLTNNMLTFNRAGFLSEKTLIARKWMMKISISINGKHKKTIFWCYNPFFFC